MAAQRTSPIAAEVPARIAALYKVEAGIRDASAAERQKVRALHSAPIIAELRRFLDTKLGLLSRKSRLAEAIRYAITRWDGLVLFLEDGRMIRIGDRTARRLWWAAKDPTFTARRATWDNEQGMVVPLTAFGFDLLKDLVARGKLEPIAGLDEAAAKNRQITLASKPKWQDLNDARWAVTPW